MVEHPRLVEQRLRDQQRPVRIAGQQHALGQRLRRAEVDRLGHPGTLCCRIAMAERRDIPDALRDAVDRTVQATVETRERAQDAVDDLVKGAEKGGRSMRAAVEDRLPATQDDVREIKAELRRIGRRLDEIEKRLPAG